MMRYPDFGSCVIVRKDPSTRSFSMPLEPISSFPPVESIPPPKRSRWKAIVGVVAFVFLLVTLFAFLRIANVAFLAETARDFR